MTRDFKIYGYELPGTQRISVNLAAGQTAAEGQGSSAPCRVKGEAP